MHATAEDHQLARDLASAVGEQLVALRAELVGRGTPTDELRDAGDRSAHEALVRALGAHRPDDAVLSEEGDDRDLRRLDARRVWIVDPLDGTREYGIDGRDDWAVHVALAIDGRPVCGAVAMPARGAVLSTAEPPRLAPAGPRRRLVVSGSRPPDWAPALAEQLDAELTTLGSAGVKAMAVVVGEADVYAHDGGQYEWDNCAPAAVVIAAGGAATRLDGSELAYNRADPAIPDLLVCRPELHRPALDALAALGVTRS
ncbi:MAG: 3'(2'),5'-bisphosphate nucleotidase CysQ [Actinomycetota bacterium]|nr:3'(2'),5'-bisphosphate nucleotidase CysQ [Actinomycetota bacterium]